MELYRLAVSSNVVARSPLLYSAGLSGRGLSVHAHHQETSGQAVTRTVVRRWVTGRPSLCVMGGP